MSLVQVLRPPFRLLINGPSRTGKTSALRKIVFSLTGVFDKIVVNSENALVNSNYSDFTSLLMEGPSLAKIMAIVDYQKKRLAEHKPLLRILLILEDYHTLYGASKEMSRLFVTARQYSISLIAVTHRLSQVPTMVRDNTTHLLITSRPRARDQAKLIANFTELGEEELAEAFKTIRLGCPLLLQPGSADGIFIRVEKSFRTRELDAFSASGESGDDECDSDSDSDSSADF